MAPPEISNRVLDAKVEACRLAFCKLSAVKTTKMKSYKQLRGLLMMKEIARRGADRDSLKDPGNSVTRILCSVLKQVVANSERHLKLLRGLDYDNMDEEQKQLVSRMINSIRGMASKKYEMETTPHLDLSEPMEMEIYLGNEEDLSGGDMVAIVPAPIVWPIDAEITVEWVENLMDKLNWFTWKNSISEFPFIMPHSVAVAVVNQASQILEKEANCVKVNCSSDGFRVIIVGDLHGHFHDLLKIFDQVGSPSENQCFVFNGNYIGSGSWSLEVLLVLLAWKILMPERVFLLRGNHETKITSEECGFSKEVRDRLGEHGDILFAKCLDCFRVLPLAAVVANIAYTTHGGLFRSTKVEEDQEKPQISVGSLDELDRLDRKHVGESEGNAVILDDVLWSSPWLTDGLSENNHRGKGLLWGPDCTETYLKQTNLKVIIRSHESPDARVEREDMGNMLSGYSLDHEGETGKLYTLFSASMFSQGSRNYENEGAYAVLEPPDYSDPKFFSFTVENIPKAFTGDDPSPQPLALETNSRCSFAAIGIANPPSWTVLLSSDASGSFPLQEAPKELEGLPLPDAIDEPHKYNYEYLFKLVGALKHEIRTREERERQLEDKMKKMKDALDLIGKAYSSSQ